MKNLSIISILLLIISCSQQEKGGSADIPNFDNAIENTSQTPLNKFANDSLKLIYNLQDTRNTEALLPLLSSTNQENKLAAILAFASIQDSAANQQLLKALLDNDPAIREAAAYAIGQIGTDYMSSNLISLIDQEESAEVKTFMLEAIGKCATDESIKFLSTYYGNEALGYGVALGLFRGMIKGKISETGLSRIVELIKPNHSDNTRIIASTYLARNREQDINPFITSISLILRNDNNPFVRMNCARALSNATLSEVENALIVTLKHDENYLVRINALRAMNSLGGKEFKKAAFEAINDKNPQVGIVASQFIQTHADKKDYKAIKKLLEGTLNWQIESNLFAAAIKIKEKSSKLALNRLHKSENIYEQGALFMSLSNDLERYDMIKERLFHATHPVIGNYAMMALAQIRQNPDFETLRKRQPQVDDEYLDIVKHCIKSKDIALIYHASLLLRDPKLDFKKQLKSTDFLEEGLKSLTLPKDIEAYQELNKTIDYLRGNQDNTPIPSNQTEHPIDWATVATLEPNTLMRIITSKGDITLKLFVEKAPGTVSEIVKLAKSGFYDGKTFHRVVPNFVAQGGCPRGDGFGGLDYTIRSEFPPLYYQEGFVGMASAGKDTESCQWFITHSPTPHLDGRYTIFAQVISGMPIVHKLAIGDIIEQIEIINPQNN